MLQMISSGESAEKLLNLTGQVWYNTIYEKSDSVTDKFTKNSSGFESDFNMSLANLSSDKDTVEKIAKIKSGQSEVSDTMKKLQNPPESFKKVYDTLLVLYISYQGFTELAINPK